MFNENKPDIEADKETAWDDESSRIEYGYPVPLNSAESGSELIEGIPENELTKIGPFLIAPSPDSHQNQFKWAKDFLVKDGTPVLAAQDGTIVAIIDNNNKWGPTIESAEFLNYITLLHDANGVPEYSQYCHLAQDSVKKLGLAVGSKVKLGDQIGVVGMTGWTDRPHLHFIAFRAPNRNDKPEVGQVGFKSLAPKFNNVMEES